MNLYKIRIVLDYIREHGGVPTDTTGNKLSGDDVLGWYGLSDLLTAEERRRVKEELQWMAAFEEFAEVVRLADG